MVSLKISGLDAAIKGIENKVKAAEQDIQNELNAWGESTTEAAIQFAPVDEGHLKGAIRPLNERLKVSITVAVNYGAYIEFGTRKYAATYVSSLPSDWQTFAGQFKGGGGGSMDEFVQNIMAWVLRKGIGGLQTKSGNLSRSADSDSAMQQAAYAIALNIIQNGIKAHPYLFPATQKTTPTLIKNIKEILSK
jgi:hypothetical protein